MWYSLEEFLDNFEGYEKLVIFNEKENIQDEFEEDEIPEEWLDEMVKDFNFSFGIIFVTI